MKGGWTQNYFLVSLFLLTQVIPEWSRENLRWSMWVITPMTATHFFKGNVVYFNDDITGEVVGSCYRLRRRHLIYRTVRWENDSKLSECLWYYWPNNDRTFRGRSRSGGQPARYLWANFTPFRLTTMNHLQQRIKGMGPTMQSLLEF